MHTVYNNTHNTYVERGKVASHTLLWFCVEFERLIYKQFIASKRPDSSLRYRRYINHLLTYLLTYLLSRGLHPHSLQGHTGECQL